MNKALKLALSMATLLLLTVVFLVGCGRFDPASDDVLSVGTLPETTAEVVPEGVLYVRCSQPEENKFSIQFVGAVPTRAVDYVGFEACKAYEDGSRGAVTAIKLYTLYNEVVDEDAGTTITAADFGMEDGYLFARALDGIPTDEPDLAYEISSYYVIGDQKVYTARQTFAVKELLEEHVLSDPEPFTVEKTSPIVDVQKWIPYTQKADDSALSEVEEDCVFYMGASAPDNNGNLALYICYPLAGNLYNDTGVRYRFTATEGENAGVSTALCRLRDDVVYEEVRTEKETLTIKDFGLEEGYIMVLKLSEQVNTVLRKGYLLELMAYYTRNALETKIIQTEIDFTALVEQAVVVPSAISVSTYTFIPNHYSDWIVFSEEAGNAVGEGVLRVRVSGLFNIDTVPCFDVQIAAATPTRFADKISLIYTVYDENGLPISGKVDKESLVQTLFLTIFGNTQEEADKLSSLDFGVERGYLMSMLLKNIELSEANLTIGLRAVYVQGEEVVTLTSLKIPVQALVDRIPGYDGE